MIKKQESNSTGQIRYLPKVARGHNFTRLVLGGIEAKCLKGNTHLKALAEIYTLHSFAQLNSSLKTMKSFSGKRRPGEKQSIDEETSRPQQCSEAWGR